MAKLQLNPAQQEKVKSLVTAATGLPLTKLGTYGFTGAAQGATGGTMGQAGQSAQGTRGPISDEGKQMTMGGQLNEFVKKAKPIATAEQEELDPVFTIGPRAYKIDDLVAQKKVLEQRFGKDSDMMKFVNNLISGKGGEVFTKPDSRKLESGAVDTVQTNVNLYRPDDYQNKRGQMKPYRGGETVDELGVITTKKGQKAGTIFDNYRNFGQWPTTDKNNFMGQLEEFLKGRGVKPYRSLKNEQRY